ncbi:MAG: WxL protein peptidoglycan domain-containing protein [Bacteroidales bacterium]
MKQNLIIFLAALFLFVLPFDLKSQEFEVAPVRLNFNIAPGESQNKTVTIKNHANRKQTFSLRMQDYLIERDGSMELLPAGSTRNSISNWVNLNPSFVELQPNESATIQVNIQAPTENYSAKWGILSFITADEQTAFTADMELQTGISLSGRIDIFLFYNPATGEAGRVEIGNLQENPRSDSEDRVFTVNIDNPGERIVNCKVFLIASDLETGEEYKFKTIDVVSYPQTARVVELLLPQTLPPGRYALAAILDYPGSTSLKGAQIVINVD